MKKDSESRDFVKLLDKMGVPSHPAFNEGCFVVVMVGGTQFYFYRDSGRFAKVYNVDDDATQKRTGHPDD